MEKTVLAIDIGGSKYMVGLVQNGRVLCSVRAQWGELSREGILESIVASARRLLKDNAGISPEIIGVTIPGLADPRSGIWVEACFSGIGNIPIATELEAAFSIPAYIDNDGQACALAERLYGGCREGGDFVYLTVSNGCGGAVFVNDMLYYGCGGNAGEIGHIKVVEGGRRCNCGACGCLEMYAAGPAIVKNFVELGGSGYIEGRPADAQAIASLARLNDPAALKTYELEGRYIGKALAAVCNVLNPKKIIIGGGVSLAFDLFEKAMWDTVNRSIYKNANRTLEIEPTRLGYNGGLIGAAAVAICGRNSLYNWADTLRRPME